MIILSAALSALWLGVLTSISPCPLATNIAAVSFIGKNLSDTRRVFVSGLVYTFGRMVTYLGIGMILVAGLLSVPGLANFLQKYMNIFLGLLLIIVGMFLVELIVINPSGGGPSAKFTERAGKGGVMGAGLLGIIFALSFCPISAALYFGSLIPLAVQHESRFLLPLVYGFGTAVPVVIFAVLIAAGAKSVASTFNKLTKFEFWARRVTGILFIIAGFYYTLHYIWGAI